MTNTNPHIYGFDLDFTLCDSIPYAQKVAEKENLIMDLSKYKDPYYPLFGILCGKERSEELHKKYFGNKYILEVKPNVAVLKILLSLKKLGNSIYIVTGRSSDEKEATYQWLDKYSIPYDKAIFTAEKCKAIREYNIDKLFEDDPDYITSDPELKDRFMVIKRPYNEYLKNEGYELFSSFL